MPLFDGDVQFILRLISMLGSMMYPFALSLNLPIFLNVLVLEKENKLLNMMKMNGLKMHNYWLINIFFFMLIQLINFFIFYLFGVHYLQLDFFKFTSPLLLVNKILFYITNQFIFY